MFVEITNSPREYAWGSTTAIPALQGRAATGRPEAEVWFGTHPGSPARAGDRDLREIAGELPFLLKLLAAGSPLSLQAHPTAAQAREGFARENAASIPLDAPHRTYKDPYAKPEMLYVLSDEFRALCGFRPVAETRAVLDAAAPGLLPGLRTDADIRPVFEWLLSGTAEVATTVADITAAAQDAVGDAWRTVRGLVAAYPGDAGIAVSLLLHTVVLRRGEALYLPAGNIHAYQEGFGIELMGPSDNVLRGGLTAKHVDVAELFSVLDFRPLPAPLLPGVVEGGVTTFAPPGVGWRLQIVAGATVPVAERGILLVLSGEVRGLGPGEAAYVADESVEVPADALVALATSV